MSLVDEIEAMSIDEADDESRKVANANVMTLECEKCGSVDVDVDGDVGVCRHCGTKMIIEENKPSVNVTKNEIHVHNESSDKSGLKTVQKIYDCKISENEFLRDACIALARSPKTPADIFDSKFEKVSLVHRKFTEVKADVALNYTASIGYDRKEEYVDVEEYTENGVKKTRPVKKTRTVTDWSPVSGQYKHGETGYGFSDGIEEIEDDIYCEYSFEDKSSIARLRDAIGYYTDSPRGIDDVKNVEEIPLDVDGTSSKAAMEDLLGIVQTQCRRSLPGDHVNEFNCTTSTKKVKEINACSAPEYSLKYKYKDSEYELRAFAFGAGTVHGSTKESSDEIVSLVEKKEMPFWFALYALCALVAVLAFIVPTSIVGVLAVPVIIYYICFRILIRKILVKNASKQFGEIKIQALEKKLKDDGMCALDANELKNIRNSLTEIHTH